MKLGIIYKATSPSGKIYIGQTIRKLKSRISQHYCDYKKSKTKFHSAIMKYGKSLIWEIVEENIPKDLLDEKEKYYVALYDSFNNGYNSTIGGQGSKGYKVPKEIVSKRAELLKGRKHSSESKKLMSKNRSGIPTSNQTKNKISKTLIGRKLTEEHRANIAIASGKRTHSEETKEKLRQIHIGTKRSKESIEKWKESNKELNSGVNNPSAILTENIVIEIRRLYESGEYTYDKLGKMYGVTESCIFRIVKRKSWKHV